MGSGPKLLRIAFRCLRVTLTRFAKARPAKGDPPGYCDRPGLRGLTRSSLLTSTYVGLVNKIFEGQSPGSGDADVGGPRAPRDRVVHNAPVHTEERGAVRPRTANERTIPKR